MSDLSVLIKDLTIKVEKMVELYNSVKEQNRQLVSDKQELSKQVEILIKEKQDLVERNKILKIAKSLSETDEKSQQIKAKINELVREIDKSLAILNV